MFEILNYINYELSCCAQICVLILHFENQFDEKSYIYIYNFIFRQCIAESFFRKFCLQIRLSCIKITEKIGQISAAQKGGKVGR